MTLKARAAGFGPGVEVGLVLGVPVAAGLGFALRSGVTSLPDLLAWPGLPRAAWLSLALGLAATALSVLLVLMILALRPRMFTVLERLLAPMLALPHAAAALGLAFLIAPSGWIARVMSPWATGWTAPPDFLTLNDPAGLALTLGLVLKETPFLLLIALSLGSHQLEQRRMVAATLGYGRMIAYLLAVWPGLYPQLRLPVLAVLVYAMTTVDMGLILGPGLPHSLAVQISLWMTEPSLAHQGLAGAGALVQLVLVMLGLGMWRGVEALGHKVLAAWAQAGVRGRGLDRLLAPLACAAVLMLGLFAVLGLAGLALWSVAGPWPFPRAVPQSLSLAVWGRAAGDLLSVSATSLGLAVAVTLAALLLTLAALHRQQGQAQGERQGERQGQGQGRAQGQGRGPGQGGESGRKDTLVYLPLIVPQVVFLPGLAAALLPLAVPPMLAVALAHLVFVLPYVFLALAGPFRAWDRRIAAVASTLGADPWRILLRLRLPMLSGPLAAAAAIGIAVSIGLYLPTLLLGGGRVATLTTEAVALASGANRRIVGAYGIMQAFWPALAFALARRVQTRLT